MSSENKTLTPIWIVYADGARLPWKYEGALKKIRVSDRLSSIGTASLVFDMSAPDFDNDDVFCEGSEVSLHLGYKDDVEEVFNGEVTGFAPRFGEYGAPQMEVQIETKLHRLDKGIRSRAFESKTTAQIIKEIITNHNLKAEVEEFGPKHNYTEQRNITDYDYITQLACKYGKAVWCQGNTVYVKTEITPSDEDVILEWGKSIIRARAKTSMTKQLSAATCTGWSIMDCRGFAATAMMKDIPLKIGGEYSWEDNSKGYDPKKIEQITTEEIIDEEDAAAVAKAYIQNRSFKFQSCDIKTQGNYHIKPGNRLTVKYIGKQSDGEYLIESVEHTLDMQGGFITRCHLIRNFCEVSNRSGTASEIDRERAESTVLVSNNMWFHIGQNMSEGNHVFIGTESNHNENTITTKKICAWNSYGEWNSEYIKMYSLYINQKIDTYIQHAERFTCEDLSLSLLIDFASENHLPITIKNGSGTYSSYTSDFSNIKSFKNKVLSTTGAADLKLNTIAIEISDVRAGDLICMDTGTPNGTKDSNYSHIQIISNVSDKIFEIRQGNISRGSSKYNSFYYGGENISKRKYDTENDLFINPDTNRNVPNARDAFGMSFRRWNFYGM